MQNFSYTAVLRNTRLGFINKLECAAIDTLLWCKKNKILQDELLQEINNSMTQNKEASYLQSNRVMQDTD